MRDQPWLEANRKISREAPRAEPLAASSTLLSRNSLKDPRSAEGQLRPRQSRRRFARDRSAAAAATSVAHYEGASRERATALPSPRRRAARWRFQFRPTYYSYSSIYY